MKRQSFILHEEWQMDGQLLGYRVGGMPDGRTARIANVGAPDRNDWRIMSINPDGGDDCTGRYDKFEDCLGAVGRLCGGDSQSG